MILKRNFSRKLKHPSIMNNTVRFSVRAMADQIGIWATVAITSGLAIEKILMRFNLYDGVRSLHMNCSSCCDVDIQRTDPNSRGGSLPGTVVTNAPEGKPMASPPTASPAPEPAPSRPYSGQQTPTVDDLMRRVSIALVDAQNKSTA